MAGPLKGVPLWIPTSKLYLTYTINTILSNKYLRYLPRSSIYRTFIRNYTGTTVGYQGVE